MSIPFTAHAVCRQLDGAVVGNFISDLTAALLDAGWSNSESTPAWMTGSFTGLPSDTHTITIDGTVYTWKNTLSAAYQVKIGATAADCASNLWDAITDNSAQEGVTYGSGTSAHTTCTAAVNGTTITVSYRTPGTSGNGVALNAWISNFSWAYSKLIGGGDWLISAPTEDGLQMRILIYGGIIYSDGANIRVASADGTVVSQDFYFQMATSRLFECHACDHQLVIYLLGTSTTSAANFMASTPKLSAVHAPKMIASVSDNGSGEFRVSTVSVAHGLNTGQDVWIDRALGVSGLNGQHQITVIDDYSYDLNGSTYASGYTANSAVSGGPTQIARAFFALGDPWGNWYTFRNVTSSGNYNTYAFFCFNQFSYQSSGAGQYCWGLITMGRYYNAGGYGTRCESYKNWGNYADEYEARIAWNVTSLTSTPYVTGKLWNAFVVQEKADMDLELFNFLGYNWRQITNGASGYDPLLTSLWLVMTAAGT